MKLEYQHQTISLLEEWKMNESKIVVEQLLGVISWVNIYVVNINNEMLEDQQGVELESCYQMIKGFKEDYNISGGTFIIFDENENEVSRRDLEV